MYRAADGQRMLHTKAAMESVLQNAPMERTRCAWSRRNHRLPAGDGRPSQKDLRSKPWSAGAIPNGASLRRRNSSNCRGNRDLSSPGEQVLNMVPPAGQDLARCRRRGFASPSIFPANSLNFPTCPKSSPGRWKCPPAGQTRFSKSPNRSSRSGAATRRRFNPACAPWGDAGHRRFLARGIGPCPTSSVSPISQDRPLLPSRT